MPDSVHYAPFKWLGPTEWRPTAEYELAGRREIWKPPILAGPLTENILKAFCLLIHINIAFTLFANTCFQHSSSVPLTMKLGLEIVSTIGTAGWIATELAQILS